MKFNYPHFIILLFGLLAACKSNNDPTTDPRFDGNRKMAKVLDSLYNVADPKTNYLLSGERAALCFQQMRVAELPRPGKLQNYTNPIDIINWETKYCFELLNAGNVDDCIKTLTAMINKYPGGGEKAIADINFKKVFELAALASLRMGENDNCTANHNSASCIVPIQSKAFHKNTKGSLTAIKFFTQILKVYPKDYQSRWLLNIAYMTLGRYPSEVPKEYFIDFNALEEKTVAFVPFENLAIELGVDVNGLAGAAIIEDFNNDGFMDIFCSSYGLNDNPSLFVSNGKGSYVDQTSTAMLSGIYGGLNAKQADFNNDGFTDILVLRGAWLDKGGEWPNSLLRNNGDGTFSDITFAAGMKNAYPTQTAAWADVNNDGFLDVFIGNENNDQNQFPCELFINNGNETFTNVADEWGLSGNFGIVKSAVCADFNNDGWQDLFIGCLNQDNKLFMNRGFERGSKKKIVFQNIANKAGVTKPFNTFPSMVFDYNNDGLEDIFCTSYPTEKLSVVGEEAAMEMLKINSGSERAKLYQNNGNETFSDVSKEAGLDKIIFAMGFNFGDLDNDGWIDVYTGTGAPEFNSLVPNRVFKNINGQRFAEITNSSGLGHLQKGHGIAFGDLDNDGDQDIYTTLGGAVEGDNAHNALFANPNHGSHWVNIALHGNSGHADAQGSRIILHCSNGNNKYTFYHTIGSGGSFGANSLQLEAGIGQSTSVDLVEIWWYGNPQKKQLIKNIPVNKFVSITEKQGTFQLSNRPAMPLKVGKLSGSCCKK